MAGQPSQHCGKITQRCTQGPTRAVDGHRESAARSAPQATSAPTQAPGAGHGYSNAAEISAVAAHRACSAACGPTSSGRRAMNGTVSV